KAPRAVRKLRHQAAAGVVIIGVAMVLIGLSLAHLAAGVALVTHASTVESWAMAIGIDIAFVSLEGANILIANEKLAASLRRHVNGTIAATILGSALFNAMAFGSAASGLMVG